MSDWMTRAWTHTLKQPDQTSCGAATLVVARMINDESYAELLIDGTHPTTGFAMAGTLEERFAAETLAMHRRTTTAVDVSGRFQMPWPQSLGTPPWAVARQMSGGSGVKGTTYAADLVSPFDRRDSLSEILHATRNGHVVPLFVGNTWSPRHVVLVLDPELVTYNPASGRRGQFSASQFTDARLEDVSWPRPWFAILPQ